MFYACVNLVTNCKPLQPAQTKNDISAAAALTKVKAGLYFIAVLTAIVLSSS